MRKPYPAVALMAVLTLVLALVGAGVVGAHGGQEAAGYEFVFGAMDEPIVTDQRTWLEVRVSDEATKAPVAGLEDEMSITLVKGDHQKTLPASRVSGKPGSYKAAVWFTEPGEFSAIVRGKTATGTPFELTFKATANAAADLLTPAGGAATTADITLQVGSSSAVVAGRATSLDAAPVVAGGRTLVPLRFIAEALGIPVHWNGATQTIHLGPQAAASATAPAMAPAGTAPAGMIGMAPVAAAPAGMAGMAGMAMGPAAGASSTPDRSYTLKMLIRGFDGVGGDIDGVRNPLLHATMGQTVRVDVVNGDPLEHDFVIDELGAHTEHVFAEGEKATATFAASKAGTFYYYCSVPGHRKAGMEGQIEVSG